MAADKKKKAKAGKESMKVIKSNSHTDGRQLFKEMMQQGADGNKQTLGEFVRSADSEFTAQGLDMAAEFAKFETLKRTGLTAQDIRKLIEQYKAFMC